VRPALARRGWLSPASDDLVHRLATRTARMDPHGLDRWLHELVDEDRRIHRTQAVPLDPAANTMNPRAEALLAAGLGSRPSLGHPGAKYETGLEAIEQIEVLAAELAAEVFGASHVEHRVPSGAVANLYAFLATTRPGAAIVAPPAAIGGHVTHHRAGAAGLRGLRVHAAPVDAARYTVEVDGLARLVRDLRPEVLTVGGSLNLTHHPVAEVRAIADEVGATVVFDAAHLSGLIAGRTWPNPLAEGAHLVTMSTYKSLAGPPAGLVLTDDPGLAERIDAIAFPGLTANFDVGSTAALALTLLDWMEHGEAYATQMVAAARQLARALLDRDVPVVQTPAGPTTSHAFAIDARRWGGGTACAHRLRRANLLTSAIGLPAGDDAGLRVGVSEVVRWGAGPAVMDDLAALVAAALQDDPDAVAGAASAWRQRFTRISHIR
jgi:glycine hydroxymethyltransferase